MKFWPQNFFQKDYLQAWEKRKKWGLLDRTEKEIRFLIQHLALKKKDKILDLCCGQGRHAIALVKKGYNVIGLDFSDYLLRIARRRMRKEKVKVRFIKQDAREMNFQEEFDVVYNLFTSGFGYFSEEDNEKFIQKAAQALKPGGRFCLDTSNVVFILKNYKKVMWYEHPQGLVKMENKFNAKTFVNKTKNIFISRQGKRKEMTMFVRMYTFPEIKNIFKNNNLKIKKAFGSFSGSQKFSEETKRLIVVAEKI